jgi:hypothetical protein
MATGFYIIATIFNPARYKSRYKLYYDFQKHVTDAGASLVTVELAFEDQPFVVTEADNPLNIQLRSNHHLWYKENLVNVAITSLPAGWVSAAWLDADISFVQPDWIYQTEAALERHAFVQMFTHAVDLGPSGEPLKRSEGFAYKHLTNPAASRRKEFGQPGYAWAARRDGLEAVGGLIDWSILGSNDYYMGRAMIAAVDPNDTRMPGSNYAHLFMLWQERFQQRVGTKNLGYVDATIQHHWHGRRADRQYDTRWKILVEHRFDPATDLRYNEAGLFELTETKPLLARAIREYFQVRNEDNPEL